MDFNISLMNAYYIGLPSLDLIMCTTTHKVTAAGTAGPFSGTFVMPSSIADDLITQAGGNN